MASDQSYPLNANGIPAFDSLPLQQDAPLYSAWNLYGPSDELGTLNRLTDERVAAAASNEIKTGVRVSLNWPLSAQTPSHIQSSPDPSSTGFFARQTFHQALFPKPPRTVNDDVWTFNTQVSSQWDGLRHFGYQAEQVFYNGVTQEAIHGCNHDGSKTTVNGIQAWAERGIVGRGVLVDFHAWRLRQVEKGRKELEGWDCFSTTPIRLVDIKACLAEQGTEVKFGDILLIRSGWMVQHATKTEEQLNELQKQPPHKFCGVEQSVEVLRWIWENFSAVAGDQPSFECWPTQEKYHLHEVLLAGWGCPIGELFDLERLAEECRRQKRWSFFVASEPCNVPGGVASPPNILAIF